MKNDLQDQKKTVLLVEDEESLRKAMSIVFRSNGYKVLQAANGSDAFEIVMNEKLDVIISDVRMPNGDGINLLQKVRNLHHEKPVLLLVTGYTDLKNEDAYDMGADGVFPKPFDRQALLDQVQNKLLDAQARWKKSDDYPVEGLLKLHVKVPSLEGEINCQILRLGRGGFFAAWADNFPAENSEVEFRIETESPSLPPLEGVGIVRWVRHRQANELSPGCGVEFKYVNTASLGFIIKYIADEKVKSLIPKG